MQHKCKVTVLDKKVYPELQQAYLADPKVGACPCYEVGDEFIFERYQEADDFWHMGHGRQCSEAWDAISRYIYTALQGGSIMRHWTNDERVMIACCSDGTRPVIFKIEREDYKVLYLEGVNSEQAEQKVATALQQVEGVQRVAFRHDKGFTEVFLDQDVLNATLLRAVEGCGSYQVLSIE